MLLAQTTWLCNVNTTVWHAGISLLSDEFQSSLASLSIPDEITHMHAWCTHTQTCKHIQYIDTMFASTSLNWDLQSFRRDRNLIPSEYDWKSIQKSAGCNYQQGLCNCMQSSLRAEQTSPKHLHSVKGNGKMFAELQNRKRRLQYMSVFSHTWKWRSICQVSTPIHPKHWHGNIPLPQHLSLRLPSTLNS